MVPSPLTLAVEQGTATFQCQHPLADGINWLLNGTPVTRAGLANVSSSIQSQGSVATYTLSIGALIEYSQTTVECVATFIDGSPLQFTEPVMLLIQGGIIILFFFFDHNINYDNVIEQTPLKRLLMLLPKGTMLQTP